MFNTTTLSRITNYPHFRLITLIDNLILTGEAHLLELDYIPTTHINIMGRKYKAYKMQLKEFYYLVFSLSNTNSKILNLKKQLLPALPYRLTPNYLKEYRDV